MKLAVMQPYLFPYIGYFQLIHAADLFLIYDDTSFIKQGYINRNSMLTANGPARFTVPVPGASSNKKISDLKFSPDVKKFTRSLEQNYSKTRHFPTIFPIIREIIESKDRSIASVCQKSYQAIFSHLGIEKHCIKTSELDYDRTASAQDRLVALCQKFGADCYINAPGGRSLYDKRDFLEQDIELKFIDPLPVEYQQANSPFVPNLSIIDVLMNCSPREVVSIIKHYEVN
ncbi:WbqC family protein [Halomonas sp. SL1]|uniref:WbqC family protein n=1 Tax=Halomonas sp. SL1 TaxID=2137478 RepID=UPI000D157EF3|nr:WbqC family protein [Halomonas sp. SL1]RAH36587.1 hypothetical protein C9J49_015495 [Halomonas sp. SL1]